MLASQRAAFSSTATRIASAGPVRRFLVAAAPARRQQRLQVLAAASVASTTRIIIQGRRLEVTEGIRSHTEAKLAAAVQHYAQIIREVDVTLSVRGGDTGTHGKKEQKVDVTVYTKGAGVVRVEDGEQSLYAAIDLVCHKLERKLQKVKERAIIAGRWPGHAAPRDEAIEAEDFKAYKSDVLEFITKSLDEEESVKAEKSLPASAALPATVARSKIIHLDVALTVEEAIEALENVGHSFYIFKNKADNSTQVVYRRTNGGYGVLVPKA